MKRTAPACLLFLLSVTSISAAETSRYVVMMNRGVSAVRAKAFMHDAEAPQRDVRDFDIINGFAATLTADEAADMRSIPGVKLVEPVAIRYALGAAFPQASDEKRNYDGQTITFGLDAIRARDVWQYSRGANINVAVVDTGVDYRHPEIAGVWQGGYNAIRKTNDPADDNSHGTHVSGTIVAADNAVGIVGVAPAAKLWGVKVLSADGSGSTDTVIAGLDWVVNKKKEVGGNWIINLSLGSADSNVAESEAMQRVLDAGILVIAASGNGSTSSKISAVSYPAAYPGVIGVGAVDISRKIAAFSNQGPELSLVGPGVDVLSSVPVGSQQLALVETNSAIIQARPLDGSKKGTITGPYVVCGLGRIEDFPASVRGKIALVQRGAQIPFAEKTRNAKAAGATAVIIYNNDSSAITWTLINPATDPDSATFDWPLTLGITKEAGDALAANPTGTLSLLFRDDDYSIFNGTSMASPHVVGAAALAWSLAQQATARNIGEALFATAVDLGTPGRDATFGFGEVDALNAAKQIAPGVFGLPQQPPPPNPVPSGRRNIKRGH